MAGTGWIAWPACERHSLADFFPHNAKKSLGRVPVRPAAVPRWRSRLSPHRMAAAKGIR